MRQTTSATYGELLEAARVAADGLFEALATRPETLASHADDPNQSLVHAGRISMVSVESVFPDMDAVDGAWVARILTDRPDIIDDNADSVVAGIVKAVYWRAAHLAMAEISRHVIERLPELDQASPAP